MRRTAALLLAALGLVCAPACGRKGALVLPAPRGPMPVTGLTASPALEAAFLYWQNPVKEISGRPVGALAAVEIWVFDKDLPAEGQALTLETVQRSARLVRKILRREFASFEMVSGEAPGLLAYSYPVGPGPSGPVKLAFAIRVIDAKGRASEFAGPVAVEIPRKSGVDRPAPEGVSL